MLFAFYKTNPKKILFYFQFYFLQKKDFEFFLHNMMKFFTFDNSVKMEDEIPKMTSCIVVSVIIISITGGLQDTVRCLANCKNKINSILKHCVSKNKHYYKKGHRTHYIGTGF